MPTYTPKQLEDFSSSYYKSPTNPDSYAFNCPLCFKFYETRRKQISHMKNCCADNDMDYYELEIDGKYTVDDFHNNNEAEQTVVQNYIRTNELSQLTHLSSSDIRRRIQTDLIAAGYKSNEYNLFVISYCIYKFFFKITDEDEAEYEQYVKIYVRPFYEPV